ncbi:MAG TPA: hypothetical protein VGX03_20100 [Candidatus Binatia bacterium]|jgi:hypothetical protein|nr:hypothetical protein [Candidatus Binatia bacterium]
MAKTIGRKLLYIPILHSSADMGSLSENLKKEYVSRYGTSKWQEHIRGIEGFWHLVTRRVLSLPLDFRRVRIYQDGLPCCNHELDIVREVAAKGSKNHQLLLQLVGRGAILMGTENPELLLEEHRLLKTTVEGTGPRDSQTAADLMRRRDAFIAKRIAETLGEGETGLLFIGALHQVGKLLPTDLQVTYLFSPISAGA